jgi:hypothetical protein
MSAEPLTPSQREAAQAAAFRALVAHLQARTDVQNIDLMNLSGFCRNCMAKWLMAGAQDQGAALDYDSARELVYGMPYGEWKARHQAPASEEQLARFAETRPLHAQHPSLSSSGG